MEIAYSNFALDPNIFGESELCGLVDRNSNFIYNRIYDIRVNSYKSYSKVDRYIKKNKELVKKLLDDFEVPDNILRKKIRQLSTSELIKILVIKECTRDSKVIILDHIDTYLTSKDLETILKGIKNNLNSINKTIIFSTSKVDNIVKICNKYIIASENRIIYNGNKIDKLPIKTKIADFVDAANKKKAKLLYYKDANDLLKAIYRSVEK